MARPILRLFTLLAVLSPAAGQAVPLPADLERLCHARTEIRPAGETPYRSAVDAYGRPVAGAAFQPGVDAYGRAVAPADVGGTVRIRPPADVSIDLTRRLGTVVPGLEKTGISNSDINLGRVTVNTATGAARYNGRPITAGAFPDAPLGPVMAEICRRRFG